MNTSFFRSPGFIIATIALVLAISTGVRHTFGLFLPAMSEANGWGREVFAIAIAVQNLVWGAAQPFTGMLADRIGAGRAMIGGAALYALGLFLMASAGTPLGLSLSAGVLIGLGMSGTTFAVGLGAVSRAVPPHRRSLAMGIASAVGSFGQFAMLPFALGAIGAFGWSMALVILAALAALMIPMSAAVVEQPDRHAGAEAHIPARSALREAAGHRGFHLLCFSFFVCGFHVVFIGIHLPAYLVDRGMSLTVGTTALALVGLFNVLGTFVCGWLGDRHSKPLLLAGIYLFRALAIVMFVTLPLSEATVYAFSAAMGLLWLSTVPATNGTVASIFGVRNMSMLTGVVFFFHQLGSFLGGWLGGYFYDRTGSYDVVWIISIALGVFAAALSLPIRENPVARLREAAS